jgi:signal transduction histidine kinase/ABC-type branched-subunit amino acid transport system ATPase component
VTGTVRPGVAVGSAPPAGAAASAAPSPFPSGAAAAPLLSVNEVSASFGRVRALDHVNLSVRAGELVALAGENGAGKTTLVRCIAGDIAPARGDIYLAGRRVPADPTAAARQGIAVVWQDLALCGNLDVAGNVLLGRETWRLMFSESRFHAAAAELLRGLRIPIVDTTRSVSSLSGGQRQLVAVARAMGRRPRLLALDEPTAALGVKESAQVEELIMGLRASGTTILLACHDIDQMFRLADRIVVLRQGRVVADLDPRSSHPDDVVALLSGQQVDSSARKQLTRLHGLAGRLVSANPSSSLSLILSALGAALGMERLCIHLVSDRTLVCAASLGFQPSELAPWSTLPFGAAGGPTGLAAATEKPAVEDDVPGSATRARSGHLARGTPAGGSWSVPVMGPGGLSGVITVFTGEPRPPQRDQLDLVTLYAGYAASAVERDRLLDQVTSRNRVLETIREMLETLAGPVPVSEGLVIAVQSLRRGLRADEVALVGGEPSGEAGGLADGGRRTAAPPAEPLEPATGTPRWRAFAGPTGTDPAKASAFLCEAAARAVTGTGADGPGTTARPGVATELTGSGGRRARAVSFMAPGGPTVLLASWEQLRTTREETALLEDAAHSLRLALEREEAGLAHQETAALRRSRELQRGFLSRLSHELRTPLTAITGYASSLLQPDVTWDGDSQQRFIDRIAAESARLGRLVDDLLDYSAIESGIMRLQPDWCDVQLVIEAAAACLPRPGAARVSVACDPALPAVWADHDRLEQVFVNLFSNAIGHNAPGTQVQVMAEVAPAAAEPPAAGSRPGELPAPGDDHAPAEESRGASPPVGPPVGEVLVTVTDDGAGMPADLLVAPFEPARRRTKGGGTGLGLSIAKGIVDAHGGRIELERLPKGTCFRIHLPVEADRYA